MFIWFWQQYHKINFYLLKPFLFCVFFFFLKFFSPKHADVSISLISSSQCQKGSVWWGALWLTWGLCKTARLGNIITFLPPARKSLILPSLCSVCFMFGWLNANDVCLRWLDIWICHGCALLLLCHVLSLHKWEVSSIFLRLESCFPLSGNDK